MRYSAGAAFLIEALLTVGLVSVILGCSGLRATPAPPGAWFGTESVRLAGHDPGMRAARGSFQPMAREEMRRRSDH